jgi:uncharacterized protein YebE (UPF0316 family)
MDSSFIFTWVILPLLIFTSRIFDVSIGTIRLIYLSKSKMILVPLLGFFEVFIWLIAITQIMRNLTNLFYYVAYAGGFAMGNFVGIYIENKLAIGTLLIRIITSNDSIELVNLLKSHGFGVTVTEGEGTRGPVKIIFTIIKRKDKQRVVDFIQRYNPNAFYTIDNVTSANGETRFLIDERKRHTVFGNLFVKKAK